MRPPRRPKDDGSAIVDFALVGALLTLLFAAVVQLGIALYVHNTLVSCAAEGARYGARADHDAADAASATRERIAESLNASYADDVSVDVEVVGVSAPLWCGSARPCPFSGSSGRDTP